MRLTAAPLCPKFRACATCCGEQCDAGDQAESPQQVAHARNFGQSGAAVNRMRTLLRGLGLLASIALLAACGGQRARPSPTTLTHVRTPEQLRANPNDILFRAIALIGTPYHHGGNTPAGGFDCSGLVGYVFKNVAGIVLPRSSEEISHVDPPSVG